MESDFGRREEAEKTHTSARACLSSVLSSQYPAIEGISDTGIVMVSSAHTACVRGVEGDPIVRRYCVIVLRRGRKGLSEDRLEMSAQGVIEEEECGSSSDKDFQLKYSTSPEVGPKLADSSLQLARGYELEV